MFGIVSLTRADEYTSSSFRVLDPVLAPAQFSTSTDFQLFGSLGELGLGTSTAASFGLQSAFLFFPVVATPVVSATAGDGSVALSWSAVTASLGWTVGGYNVGQATVSGGPYSYTSLGNVTSITRSSLANGTPYYFVIRPEDALGYTIATSTEVSATPVASYNGGGGGGGTTRMAAVELNGLAYPDRPVTVLLDGIIVAEARADANGQFQARVGRVALGTQIFAVYSEDIDGRQSRTITFPVTVTTGGATRINGIFVPPTLSSDKEQITVGEPIIFFGQGPAATAIELIVTGQRQPIVVQVQSGGDGRFRYRLETKLFPFGQYETNVRARSKSGLVSQFGQALIWKIGAKIAPRPSVLRCPKPADLNDDCRVNLTDFSILVYWLDRPQPPLAVDLKSDGRIDLKDFGIAAYYWTG